jgi:hypothetical protein
VRLAFWRFAVLALALATLLLVGNVRRQVSAQSAAPPGYVVLPAGWNLLSTATAQSLDVPSADATLLTLQPGDSDYESVDWQSLSVGYGYWAYLRENTALRLPASTQDSYSVTIPAQQWVMVGNPTTRGSVRVHGADRSLLYSAITQQYRQDDLIPVGAGALVWSDQSATVTLGIDPNDATPVDFDSCCRVGSGQYGGQALIDIDDDTPYPLLYGIRAVATDGTFPAASANNYAYGAVSACADCVDYTTPPPTCRDGVPTRSVRVDPGSYLLRLTTDAVRVPDIILAVQLQADTHYALCRYVLAGRP